MTPSITAASNCGGGGGGGGGGTIGMANPVPGSTLPDARDVLFTWTAGGASVQNWFVYVGSSRGGDDIYHTGHAGSVTSALVYLGLSI